MERQIVRTVDAFNLEAGILEHSCQNPTVIEAEVGDVPAYPLLSPYKVRKASDCVLQRKAVVGAQHENPARFQKLCGVDQERLIFREMLNNIERQNQVERLGGKWAAGCVSYNSLRAGMR